jgi:hypothetical protein
MCLQFGFVIFWQKDFGAKAAHKMLVKLTPKLGQIFDACCISATRISAPKRLAAVVNTKKLFNTN